MTWGDRSAPGQRQGTAIMGILNVTPDSFFDGGRRANVEAAVDFALRMVEAGADMIDVGGESTRPGAEPVELSEELDRVLPVIGALRSRTDVAISIDTTKAQVARGALELGAEVINDVSAMTIEDEMVDVAREHEAGIVLMHMRGLPPTMQKGDLSSADICAEVTSYLGSRIESLTDAGIARERICIDPGVGFGKSVEQNLLLLANMEPLNALGRPVLIGASRKSYLGALTERNAEERLAGSLASTALSAFLGAHLVRVHDVAETRDALAVAAAFQAARREVSK